jgi:hypothetical protein
MWGPQQSHDLYDILLPSCWFVIIKWEKQILDDGWLGLLWLVFVFSKPIFFSKVSNAFFVVLTWTSFNLLSMMLQAFVWGQELTSVWLGVCLVLNLVEKSAELVVCGCFGGHLMLSVFATSDQPILHHAV